MYQYYPENSIDDFQVFELLGKGGFAHVYRAKSLLTGQEVAIKMINKKTIAAQPGLANRVRREVEIHSRLKHSSILELYTCFEDNNHVYLVLELCPYGELQSYIRENGPISEDAARRLLSQILHGILYLHSHHILHRDLTLSNLLLNKEKRIKIADFGLATRIEPGQENLHQTMCGTPNYISPEIASKGEQSLESDVWSIGCMLYILLVGRPPFESSELRNTLKKVKEVDYHLPGNLSSTARDLIINLLQKNPSDRIKLRAIFQHPFMTLNENSYLEISQKPDVLLLTKMDRSQDSGIDSMSRTPSHGIFPSKLGMTPGNSSIRRSISANINIKSLSSSMTKSMSTISQNGLNPAFNKNKLKKLNTKRLIPIRSCTRVASMSVQKDGSVLGQFFSLERPKEGIIVVRVMWISPDGNHIIYYQPNNGRGVLWKHPKTQIVYATDCDFYEEFSFENLPPMYHKDYKNLAKFVSTVRSSTPKIILYHSTGKSMLMEFDEPETAEEEVKMEFITNFTEGSNKKSVEVKFVDNASNVKFTNNGEQTISLNLNDSFYMNSLTKEQHDYVLEAQGYRQKCIDLERMLSQMGKEDENCSYFPAVFGRSESVPRKTQKTDLSLPESIASLVMNAKKKVSMLAAKPNVQPNPEGESNGVNDPIFVPKVGWAVKSTPDTLDINFNDGARLSISYNSEEINKIRYVPPGKDSSCSIEFTTGSKIPPEVHSRLEAVPAVVKFLRSQSQAKK